MLPDDTDFHADDGNQEITHDFVNALERSIDAGATPNSDGVYPVPTGTAVPWGGGKVRFAQCTAGVLATGKWIIDEELDYRNRWIKVLAFGLYNAANKLPGGAAYACAGGPGYDYPCDSLTDPTKGSEFWTAAGAPDGDPPASGAYLTLEVTGPTVRGHLFADNGDAYQLKFHNSTGSTVYGWIVYFVSDQLPART